MEVFTIRQRSNGRWRWNLENLPDTEVHCIIENGYIVPGILYKLCGDSIQLTVYWSVLGSTLTVLVPADDPTIRDYT